MIDAHTHLEQKDYDNDREEIIQKYKTELDGVITCCAHPSYIALTFEIVKKHKDFIFCSVAIHPEYINELNEELIEETMEIIKSNRDKIVGIGETGLDYFWVKDDDGRKNQINLFRRFIALANELNKPIIVHSRNADDEIMKILEEEDVKSVYWHMFGSKELLSKVIEHSYYIGVNAILLTSKNYRKIVRDIQIDRILLETDAPWLSPITLKEKRNVRNDSLTVKLIAEKIAEIKKIPIEDVDKITTLNTIKFYNLPQIYNNNE